MRLLGFLCIVAIILEMVVIWPPFVIVFVLFCIMAMSTQSVVLVCFMAAN